ncbi:transcriptional repressor [Micrococcus porci]|uniref:Fur family transcriptional regulator n=1 Tax=Micrococcus TaxID=1269 RepID=UPI001CCD0DCB|nr:Fur family transcriptional regulator [Micrococcus porci]MCG7421829.1 transcriptional repressor [Micrococcus sp. ACRRV]UBH24261.1 transcriptional repressor [Micrococcus porci]
MSETPGRPSEAPAPRGRSTRQKAAVDGALDAAEDFVSAQELHARLRDAGERVSLATVYRALQQRLDEGTVDMLRREDGESVYRRCAAEGHHHHLVCRVCWTTVEVTAPGVEEWAARMAAEHGFSDPDHTVEITGVCAECRAAGRG